MTQITVVAAVIVIILVAVGLTRLDSIPPVPANLTDWAQVLAYIAGGLAAVVGVFVGLREYAHSTKQRAEDLRWKRAKAAQDLIKEMWDDQAAAAGMRILEWPGSDIGWEGSVAEGVTRSDMRAALGPKEQYTPRDTLICDAIDSLLWHFAAMEHHITTELVVFEHLRFPAEYYIRELSADYDVVGEYLERHGLSGAKAFLNRFDVWEKAVREDAGPQETVNHMTTGQRIAPKREGQGAKPSSIPPPGG